VAQVEVDDAHRAAGTRLLRWSNAGHLPPLLVTADGAATFLEAESDLVLGWDPAIDRHDHEHVLQPGSTVLLYTDGLVERRGVHLERGLAWLAEAAGELVAAGTTLEELCDALVGLVGDHLDDDVALLALRAHPEDEPMRGRPRPRRPRPAPDAAPAVRCRPRAARWLAQSRRRPSHDRPAAAVPAGVLVSRPGAPPPPGACRSSRPGAEEHRRCAVQGWRADRTVRPAGGGSAGQGDDGVRASTSSKR
jgi:hypothetical protein